VKQSAIARSRTAVREWGKELESVLDDQANPDEGLVRRYSEDDVIKLHTAKVLRAEGNGWKEVIEAIEAGDKILPDSEIEPEKPPTDDTGLVSAEWWDRMTEPFKDHVATLEAQLVVSQAHLDNERLARIESEVDAARMAGQLEAIYRRYWWQVWRPERPEGDGG
jgi:DNA-binding transcriptional MerR regulator